MKRAAVFVLFLALLTGCASTPQKKAQAAISARQGIILARLGYSYRAISFGPISPLYSSPTDTVVIVGYYMDHRFTTGEDPTYSNISDKRYYFPPDISRIIHQASLFGYPGISSADSIARAILSGAAQ